MKRRKKGVGGGGLDRFFAFGVGWMGWDGMDWEDVGGISG